MLPKAPLMGVSVTVAPVEKILSVIETFLSKKKSAIPLESHLTIVTPNPEQIMLAQKDPAFQAILNHADIALPDGMGVVWALKKVPSIRNQVSSTERIPGIDFMEQLCAMASKNGWPVAFIGGRRGVGQKALINLQKKYPGLTGFTDDGPVIHTKNSTFDIPRVYVEMLARLLKEKNIRFVFVGLGAPKQEYFVEYFHSVVLHIMQKNPLVLMSVGGSFDIFAGKIKRAPKSVQSLGFEWLWRLFHEPWRIKRQMVLVEFFLKVLFQR